VHNFFRVSSTGHWKFNTKRNFEREGLGKGANEMKESKDWGGMGTIWTFYSWSWKATQATTYKDFFFLSPSDKSQQIYNFSVPISK
jgi:hypothetical protein